MSESFKKRVGEELYNKILETGVKPHELDLSNFVPRSRLNEVSGKLKATEEKITSYENQLEETKNLLSDNDDLKNKYESLNNKYVEDLAVRDKEIVNTKKSFLLESELTKQGAKHAKLIMRDVDLDKLSIDGDNLIGLNDTVTGLKENYSDMFIQEKTEPNKFNKSKGNDNPSDSNVDWESKLDEYI